MIATIRRILDFTLGWLLAVLMGVSVLNVMWQVVGRYLLTNPGSYTEELSRYLLIWIGLLGAAYALGKGQHLAIDLLPQMLSGRARKTLNIAIALAILAFAGAVFIYGGANLVHITLHLGQKSAAMRIPLGYIYLAIPISGVLMVIYTFLNIADQLAPAPAPREATQL